MYKKLTALFLFLTIIYGQKNQDAGNYSVFWDATNNNGDNVSAGMYMYSVQAGEKSFMKKMVYLK